MHFDHHRTCPLGCPRNDCRTSTRTGNVHCRGSEPNSPPAGYNFVGHDSLGFAMFAAEDPAKAWSPSHDRRAKVAEQLRKDRRKSGDAMPTSTSQRIFDQVTREKATPTDRQLERLSEELGFTITRRLADQCGVEFLANDGTNYPAWVFTIRNATGAMVGYSLRYRREDAGADKKGLPKATRGNGSGLFMPAAWDRNDIDPKAPVYVPEGASDTMAFIAAGFNAAGRVNNTSGAEQLAELVRANPDTDFVLVGENDLKADGSWPGREGAESVAAKVYTITGRRLKIVYPPAIFKDFRETLVAGDASFRGHAERTAIEFVPTHGWTKPATRPASVTTAPAAIPARVPHPHPMDVDDLARAKRIQDGVEPNPFTCETKCERKRTIFQKHRFEAGRWRFIFPDCRQLSCPHCRERAREQRVVTIGVRIAEHSTANPGATYFGFWADPHDWSSIRRTLRNHGGQYLKFGNGPRIFVISSTKPTSKAVRGVMEMTAAEAIERGQAAVICDSVVDEEAFTTSRGWKLVDDEPRPRTNDWESKRLSISEESARQVMRAHKLKIKKTMVDGLFFRVEFSEFDPREAKVDAVALEGDLTCGEVISAIPSTFDFFGTSPPQKGVSVLKR